MRTETGSSTTGHVGRNGVGKRVAALKSFNVRTYLLGSSLSYIGTFTQAFAQWWLVLTISGNRTALPITIGLQAAPLLLLGTWGGTIVDRFDNRRLLGVTTVLNVVAAVGLGVIVAGGGATVGTVYLFSLLSGMLLVFERPALQAILSELSQPGEISSAVGLNAMVQPLSRLVGPPLASLVIAVSSIQMCCYVNGVSYVLFLVSLGMLRRSEMLPRRRAGSRKGMVSAGWRYARQDPVVGPVLLSMFFVGLAGFNFPMVMPLMARYTFHVSAARLSVPMACSAIGSLIGGAVVAGMRTPTMRMLGVGAAIFGVVLAAYGAAPTYALWVAVAFPIGVVTSMYTTMVIQLLQQSSPPEMLGRVMALYGMAFLGTTPIGAILVAWLASSFDARAPFLIGGAVVLLSGAAMLLLASRRTRTAQLLLSPS
ncbi:MAG: transporter [Acidimicrobiales bacterium]|nr:transporter [Acidimicrobiales bacterium]